MSGNSRRPYAVPVVGIPHRLVFEGDDYVAFPVVPSTEAVPELGASAALIVAVTALDAIREALDDDADETGVALYNPRHTVGKIREILARSDAKLAAVKS